MNHSPVLRGAMIVDALKAAGIRFIAALPDIVTCEAVLWPISRDRDFKLVMVCKEDEGVSICAGLSHAGLRAALLMQHTGFLDSINAIRALGMDYGLPIVMMVGLQGMEAELDPEHSGHNGIRILKPILRAMTIDHAVVDEHADAGAITAAIDNAYEHSRPLVFLISRPPR
ncbi:MAG: thiamine pyrophosphate-binding protein [Gammaproteobacteria bacterium]|nr:thiamine pyrophosphate-binding protein [Gammaproteobacteria bacterium]